MLRKDILSRKLCSLLHNHRYLFFYKEYGIQRGKNHRDLQLNLDSTVYDAVFELVGDVPPNPLNATAMSLGYFIYTLRHRQSGYSKYVLKIGGMKFEEGDAIESYKNQAMTVIAQDLLKNGFGTVENDRHRPRMTINERFLQNEVLIAILKTEALPETVTFLHDLFSCMAGGKRSDRLGMTNAELHKTFLTTRKNALYLKTLIQPLLCSSPQPD